MTSCETLGAQEVHKITRIILEHRPSSVRQPLPPSSSVLPGCFPRWPCLLSRCPLVLPPHKRKRLLTGQVELTLSKVPVKGTVGYVEKRGNPHEWGANPCGRCVAAGKIQSLRPSRATQSASPPPSKSRGFQSLALRKLKEF